MDNNRDQTKETIVIKVAVDGGEQCKAEIKAICTSLEHLCNRVNDVNKSISQLTESLKVLMELRKAAI